MWPDETLCDLVGIEHPIIQAPMAGATTPEMVAAVSNAGGLGSFGAAATPPEKLREVVRAIRALTDRPFGVNLFVPEHETYTPDPDRERRVAELLGGYFRELDAGEPPPARTYFGPFDAQLEVLLEARVPVFSFHLGIAPPKAITALRESGAVVMGSATNVREARALEAAGVDAVVAQGSEAGGHRGTFSVPYRQALIGTTALVPQIADAVSLPVVAAGGIMDARGVVAALALGACGAQLGTAFLASPESPISAAFRDRLLSAADDETAVTTVISGKPARGIRNRYMEEMEPHADDLLPFSAQYAVYGGLRAAAAKQGRADFLPMWAGQGLTLTRARPAGDIVASIVEESRALLRRLGSRG